MKNKIYTEDNWRPLCIYLILEMIVQCVWLAALSLCSISRYKKKSNLWTLHLWRSAQTHKASSFIDNTTLFIFFLCYYPAMAADVRCLGGIQTSHRSLVTLQTPLLGSSVIYEKPSYQLPYMTHKHTLYLDVSIFGCVLLELGTIRRT